MKKFIVLLLALLMVFAFVACKNDPAESAPTANNASKEDGQNALLEQGASDDSKAIDHKGFNIQATFGTNDAEQTVYIGGCNDIYWIGADPENLRFYSEVKVGDNSYQVKVLNEERTEWLTWEAGESLKEAVFDLLANQILYISFDIQLGEGDGFSNGFSGVAVADGKAMRNGRECTKYTSSFSADGIGKIVDVDIYVDNEFAFTVGMECRIADEFKAYLKNLSPVFTDEYIEAQLTSGDLADDYFFTYTADVDLELTDSDLADIIGYAEASALSAD